jgi:hypothetical protein
VALSACGDDIRETSHAAGLLSKQELARLTVGELLTFERLAQVGVLLEHVGEQSGLSRCV